MARKPDPNSPRQRVFAYLDNQLGNGKSREELVKEVCSEFDLLESYAATLYQSHRKIAKGKGKLTEVFVVRDHKDGKTVNPYVSSHYVPKVKDNDATSISDAKANYESELNDRIAKAKKL